MGMSASQARYLNLVAKQSDLEFQGQQINQSRTTLSDQTNNLYAQLQNLDVPVPPVTQDYTDIVYTTSDGACEYRLGTIRPSTKEEGKYNLDLKYSAVGASINKTVSSSSISYSDATLNVTSVTPKTETVKTGKYAEVEPGKTPEFYISNTAATGITAESDFANYLVKDAEGNLVQATEFKENAEYYAKTTVDAFNQLTDEQKAGYKGVAETTEQQTEDIVINAASLSEYYVKTASGVEQLTSKSSCLEDNGDGTYTVNLTGIQLYSLGGNETITNPNPGELLIGGSSALTYQEAFAKYENAIAWKDYETGIKNSFGEDAKLEDFYYVITPSNGAYDVDMFLKTDVPQTVIAGATAPGYVFETGTYTATDNKDYVDIVFDSTGRVSKIKIPTEDKDGKPVQFKELDVTAKTETNNVAYEEAMAKYEHKKYLYDKEQTEINAQMSIIQSQDKKLELKLQRLDNERTQITTELEALKKVVGDNIEKTYKTFSG